MPEAKLFRMPKARFILYFALLATLLAVCAAFLWPSVAGVYPPSSLPNCVLPPFPT